MKRSRSFALIAVVVGAIALAGCAPADNSADSGAEKPTLSVWINSATPQPALDLFDRFTDETGYELEVTSFPSDGYESSVLQRWATGDRPDVFQWSGNFNWLAAVNPTENLYPLEEEEFVGRTVGGILDNAGNFGGVVYGALINAPTSFGLYFNKEVIEAAGIESPPTTASELLEACKKIQAYDPNITPFQEAAGSLWTPLVFHGSYMADALQDGYLERLNSRDAKVSDPDSPWLTSLEFYMQMVDEGCFNDDIMTHQFENNAQLLLDGEAAFVSMHTGFIQQLIAASDEETAETMIGWTPWAAERPVVTSEADSAYYVPKTGNATKEAGAFEFIRYITGDGYDQYVVDSNQVPILEGVETPDTLSGLWEQVQTAVAEYGTVPPIWGSLPGITDLVNYPGQLIIGELTPESAVALLQDQAALGAEQAGLPTWED